MEIHQSCDDDIIRSHEYLIILMIWKCVFDWCVVCVQKPESRNSRGSIDREDGALQTPVSSHNPLLVFVSSQREIYSAVARTHFLSESQPAMPITLAKIFHTAEKFRSWTHSWAGIWNPERRVNDRGIMGDFITHDYSRSELMQDESDGFAHISWVKLIFGSEICLAFPQATHNPTGPRWAAGTQSAGKPLCVVKRLCVIDCVFSFRWGSNTFTSRLGKQVWTHTHTHTLKFPFRFNAHFQYKWYNDFN